MESRRIPSVRLCWQRQLSTSQGARHRPIRGIKSSLTMKAASLPTGVTSKCWEKMPHASIIFILTCSLLLHVNVSEASATGEPTPSHHRAKGGSNAAVSSPLSGVSGPRTGGRQQSKKKDLYVAGFFPINRGLREGDLGRGVMPAVDLAISDVNSHPKMLNGYKLNIINNDTKCDTAWGTKAFFDQIHNKPKKLALFGAACTQVTDPIAKASKFWHIIQLSYADTHPMFSKENYPNFYRIVPSETELNPARVRLLLHFNWTKVGTLYQNEPRYSLAENNLVSLLEANNITIAMSQGIASPVNNNGADDVTQPSDDSTSSTTEEYASANADGSEPGGRRILSVSDNLRRLKEADVRIVLGTFNESWAIQVFCQAYRLGMYGAKYQWILTGMTYSDRWWLGKPATRSAHLKSCSSKQILTALSGTFIADLLPLRTDNMVTVAQKTAAEYEMQYHQERHREYSRYHGYAYDGIWALALIIHGVTKELKQLNWESSRRQQQFPDGSGSVALKRPITLDDFEYRHEFWGRLFQKVTNDVKFEGVTGLVSFTNNTRKGLIRIKQFRNDHETKVGEYNGLLDRLDLDKGDAIFWPDGLPPRDRTKEETVPSRVNLTIYSVLVTISCLGIIMACYFLAINIKHRNQRYIKMSSPYLNNLIILGCILTYSSVIFLGLDSQLTSIDSFPYICAARTWILMAGFTLAFGSMFSKTWRVYTIFTDIKLNKKVIKDYQLFMVVGILLAIDIAIMTTWQIVDPFSRAVRNLKSYPDPSDKDAVLVPVQEYCESRHMTVFVCAIYGYKGLLLIFGCFLAWETRNVSLPALNDSKYVGMSVYNVVIMCILGVAISFVLVDQQDAAFLIISLFIIFCTSVTLCLVFVPKLIELRLNTAGPESNRVRATLKPPRNSRSGSFEDTLLQDSLRKARVNNSNLRRQVDDKQTIIVRMMNELSPLEEEETCRKRVTYGEVKPESSSLLSLNSRDAEMVPLDYECSRGKKTCLSFSMGKETEAQIQAESATSATTSSFPPSTPTPASGGSTDAIKPMSIPLLDLLPNATATISSRNEVTVESTPLVIHHNEPENQKLPSVLNHGRRTSGTSVLAGSAVSSGSPVQTNPPNSPSGVTPALPSAVGVDGVKSAIDSMASSSSTGAKDNASGASSGSHARANKVNKSRSARNFLRQSTSNTNPSTANPQQTSNQHRRSNSGSKRQQNRQHRNALDGDTHYRHHHQHHREIKRLAFMAPSSSSVALNESVELEDIVVDDGSAEVLQKTNSLPLPGSTPLSALTSPPMGNGGTGNADDSDTESQLTSNDPPSFCRGGRAVQVELHHHHRSSSSSSVSSSVSESASTPSERGSSGRTNTSVSDDDRLRRERVLSPDVSYGALSNDDRSDDNNNKNTAEDHGAMSEHSMNLAEAEPASSFVQRLDTPVLTTPHTTPVKTVKNEDRQHRRAQYQLSSSPSATTSNKQHHHDENAIQEDSDWRGSAATVDEDAGRSECTFSRTESIDDSVREAEETRSVVERTPASKSWRDHPPLKEAASMSQVCTELPWPPASCALLRDRGHHPHYYHHNRTKSTGGGAATLSYPHPYPFPYHRGIVSATNRRELGMGGGRMGAKPRTASGNVLARTEVDDVDIVPIFHKLLIKRRGLSPSSSTSASAMSLDQGKFSVASCPNIVVKCDIVEYL